MRDNRRSAGTVYEVICEWDIGLENELYDTPEQAEEEAREAILSAGLLDDGDTYESLTEDGLICIKPRHVNKK